MDGSEYNLSNDQVFVDAGIKLPEPPEGFTEDQAARWRELMRTHGPDLFGTAAALDLASEYVRAMVSLDRMAVEIDKLEAQPYWNEAAVTKWEALTDRRTRIQGQALSIATKLRLTNQALIKRDATQKLKGRQGKLAAGAADGGQEPWNWTGEAAE